MTGIAAIFAPGPARQAQLDQMMAAMDERIRDDSGTWLSSPFALGALVLHTTAESLEAAQPLANEDASLVLVMDGYLTNWEELRRDLSERGAVLRNRSDAELVLRAYEQWGEECANRLEGEFAIIIADQRRRRIFALRDHQGHRPLHVYEDGDALLFASDIAAIVKAARNKPAPNLDYLAGIATNRWYQRDSTVWVGIERVPQSHWLSHDGRVRTVRRYYTIPEEVTLHYRRDEEYVEHYRAMLTDAVRRTSRSHRTLAIAVSGGLDSSAVYCIADRLDKEGRLHAPGLQGYTMADPPGTPFYEVPYAMAATEHCGRTLTQVPLFRPSIEWFTARGRADCDVPIPQNNAMSIYLEQRAHADGAVVFLNGTGGDQWLDGTLEYYTEFARSFDVGGFAAALLRDSRAMGWRKVLPSALRMGASAFLPLTLRRISRQRRRERRYRDPADLFWMLPEWRDRLLAIEQRFIDALPEAPRAQGNWNRLYTPYNTYSFDTMHRQTARSGIESREPMLTRQFIEFGARAPKRLFRQAGVTKVLHRQAMRGIMPDMIVDRRTKAESFADDITSGFAQYAWRNGPGVIDRLCDVDGLARLTGFVGDKGIDPYHGWQVWGVYAVAAFLRGVASADVADVNR